MNETVVIAAVIVDAPTRKHYLHTLRAEMFFGPGHAAIWAALQEMDQKGLHYDPATLKQIGGDVDVQYVEALIAQRPVVPPNLKHHLEMLYWDAARVSTAGGAVTTFLEMLKDPKTDPLALRAAARQIEIGLTSGTNHSLRNPQQLVGEQSAAISKRRDGVAVYPLGLPGLDYYGPDDTELRQGHLYALDGTARLIPGTSPQTITVVTGVSGSGKTTATARCVLGMAFGDTPRRIAYGAYEQGSGMTLELLAGMHIGMSRTDLMTGHFGDEDEVELREAMEAISERVLFDEIPFNNFSEKRERFQNQRAMDRIAQSIVDSRCDVYIADLFRRTLGNTDPDDEERALYRMQEMAKALNVHIILVQQQNVKQVETTKHKLPTRETIKGSGAWVEVPDMIIGWHRPALWRNVPDDRICSLVLKQRYGKWPQMIEHKWDATFGLIEGGKTVEMQFAGDSNEGETVDAFLGAKEPKKGRR